MGSEPRKATTETIDCTNVKDIEFSPKRVPSGNYTAKITKLYENDSAAGNRQWVLTLVLTDDPMAIYPYYLSLETEWAWKIRNVGLAAGMNMVEKKKYKLNPDKLTGKVVGVTLSDDEYKDKPKSVVTAIFPAAALNGAAKPAAARAVTRKKAAPADVDEVADEDFDELSVDDDEIEEL
jgi:hypothetical protein